MNTLANSLSVRDHSEITRSASEAAKADLNPLPRAQLQRYLNPPAATPYLLEYAFYLLGDVHGKVVLDLGCGKGENLLPLLLRGAYVIGIDISPELIEIARERKRRFATNEFDFELHCGSAYETGLPNESVDVLFCSALIHHLEIPRVQHEMLRILKPGGYVILSEPIRFSKVYAWLRTKFFPAHPDISDYEHPLTREELDVMLFPFRIECLRYFRLPLVALAERYFSFFESAAIGWSATFLERWPWLEKYATGVVVRLVKEEKIAVEKERGRREDC